MRLQARVRQKSAAVGPWRAGIVPEREFKIKSCSGATERIIAGPGRRVGAPTIRISGGNTALLINCFRILQTPSSLSVFHPGLGIARHLGHGVSEKFPLPGHSPELDRLLNQETGGPL